MKENIAKCDTELIRFKPRMFGSDNEGELEIYVNKPKGMDMKGKKALIYFHGGGAVM